MKSTFKEWYTPTPDELRRLWLEGAIILDANVLLDFYLYPPPTLAEFFKVLENVANRLWLPHQAGLEYQQNRIALQMTIYYQLFLAVFIHQRPIRS